MQKNVLITGAAKRIGASCARLLHLQGYHVVLHYRTSKQQVVELANQLNQIRPDSAKIIQADLLKQDELQMLAKEAEAISGGLDILINNASAFFPQAIKEVTQDDWDLMLTSNLKAPFFLSQALMESLKTNHGCIINIIDIHAETGLKGYPVYSMSKAGLAAMTKILAKELAPEIRVNGVSPGAIMWPEAESSEQEKNEILQKVALERSGEPEDIAKAVSFLVNDANYITGQIITVDGGRTLFR